MTRAAEVSRDDENESTTVVKVQERPSDCARGASRMRQREWVEKERWVGMNCGRIELTGAIC